jgi:hypothetical protein
MHDVLPSMALINEALAYRELSLSVLSGCLNFCIYAQCASAPSNQIFPLKKGKAAFQTAEGEGTLVNRMIHITKCPNL